MVLAFDGRMSDYIRSGAYNMKTQAIKGIKKMPKTAFRTARRVGIGALTGGAAGLAALGVGATMSPEKAMALTATAFSAGSNFGNYYGDKFAKASATAHKGAKRSILGKRLKSSSTI